MSADYFLHGILKGIQLALLLLNTRSPLRVYMNTPSHFLITAGLKKALPRVPVSRSAVWLGSVAPDIPLYLMAVLGFCYFRYFLGWDTDRVWNHIWGTLYFENAWWIGFHNFLHSPVSLLFLLIVFRFLRERFPQPANWMRGFLWACLLHGVIDTLTHHDDGVRILWPLHWTFRFYSPVSYWDHAHFGHQFMIFELGLDLLLIGYLIVPWMKKRLREQRSPKSFDN